MLDNPDTCSFEKVGFFRVWLRACLEMEARNRELDRRNMVEARYCCMMAERGVVGTLARITTCRE
jgi:hypothetical protein